MRSITFGKKEKTLHSSIRNLYHLWNMVVVVSWFGTVLLHLGQDDLPSLMNSELYQQILKENIRTSVPELSLKRKWAMQQDNDPKHTSHFTREWLKKNKVNVLEWPSQSQSLDLNPTWNVVEGAEASSSEETNITELKWFCTEEWADSSTRYWAELIKSWKKLYLQLLLKNGVTPDTESKDSHTFAMHRYVTMDNFSQ